jgi:hypothetical protein
MCRLKWVVSFMLQPPCIQLTNPGIEHTRGRLRASLEPLWTRRRKQKPCLRRETVGSSARKPVTILTELPRFPKYKDVSYSVKIVLPSLEPSKFRASYLSEVIRNRNKRCSDYTTGGTTEESGYNFWKEQDISWPWGPRSLPSRGRCMLFLRK